MKEKGHIIAILLFSISNILKVCSVVLVYSTYIHTEELEEEWAHKTTIKREYVTTHKPLTAGK